MSQLIGRELNLDYMNYSNYNQINISENNPDLNINDLEIKVIDGETQIKWKDCENLHWKSNILVRSINNIPATVFAGQVITHSTTKNLYIDLPFVDNDIEQNTLYCYRVFTELDNSEVYYSGLKNIFFVYVYGSNFDFSVITGGMILQDPEHMFVTKEQIDLWNMLSGGTDIYTKEEIDSMISEINSITLSERTKLDNIDKPNSDHYTVSQDQIDLWNSKENSASKGQPNGYAALDSNSKISINNMPSFFPGIAKGQETFNGQAGTKINIPVQSNTNYVVIIQPAGINNNPNGYLGETYVEKSLSSIIVYNTGSAKTTFDYMIF